MKRLNKISSLLAVVTLVAALFGFAAPAAPASADFGNMQFTAQILPTATGMTLAPGTNVTDIAQSGDGTVIYVVDSSAATGLVYKSTTGGRSFTPATAPAPVTLNNVAVAPDNPDVVAVGDTANGVYISSNGGSTWTILPAIAGAVTVTDLTVGPARSGTLLGREYVVSLADPAAGVARRADRRRGMAEPGPSAAPPAPA